MSEKTIQKMLMNSFKTDVTQRFKETFLEATKDDLQMQQKILQFSDPESSHSCDCDEILFKRIIQSQECLSSSSKEKLFQQWEEQWNSILKRK